MSVLNNRLVHRATLLSLTLLASLAAPGGAIMAKMPAVEPNLEGRWIEAAAGSAKSGIQRIGILDIMPCGNAMCGVQVSAAGECGAAVGQFGPPQLRPTIEGDAIDALYRGTLKWHGTKNVATIWLSADGLKLTARPNALAASLSRSVMPSFSSNFVRSGAAKCAAQVS